MQVLSMKFFYHYHQKIRTYYTYKYIKFIIIGSLSNIISYILFNIFFYYNFNIEISASFGMTAGVANTYLLSRLYLNQEVVKHSNIKMLVFFLYYALTILITSNSIKWITEITHINHNISWLLCSIIASFFNFIFVSKIALHIKKKL